MQIGNRDVAERDRVAGVERQHGVATCGMQIGFNRGKIGKHALGQVDKVLRRVEIADRFLAEAGREDERVRAVAGGSRYRRGRRPEIARRRPQ